MSYQAATAVHQHRTASVLDSLSLQFVIWAQAATGPALDVGCGDGTAARALLARGGHIVAIDPDAGALHRLLERVPTEQCRRLKVRLGQLPDIDFKVANFAAIHAARVLHLLDPVSLASSLRKFYRWLYPEGKLFVSMPTPKGTHRTLQITAQTSPRPRAYPLDESTLVRQLHAAGFVIEDTSTYLPPWNGAQECYALVARCASYTT